MSTNAWLYSHGRRVGHLVRQLEEHRLKGTGGGEINFGELITLFRGVVAEIERLQKEQDELLKRIKELKELRQKREDDTITNGA